jgi:hypothetical protein
MVTSARGTTQHVRHWGARHAPAPRGRGGASMVTFEEGTVCTGATPGKLLRSYDMVGR